MNDLLVMKFGGTSVGSAERMRAAARITIEQKQSRPVLIVVSAMSKITDLLLESMRRAEAGDRVGLDANLRLLRERHLETCRELLPPVRHAEVTAGAEALIAEFERLTNGMLILNDRPPRSVDEAVAIGERLSALLMAAHLNAEGARAIAVNAADVVVTDAVFGNASPLMEPTREKTRKHLLPRLKTGIIPVVTGFNGATADGRPTTLGRGGSDFSASILAAALDAAELWIWTDVDGIMTADPRLVPRRRRALGGHLRRSRRACLQWRQGAAPTHAGAAGRQAHHRVEQEQLRHLQAGHQNRALHAQCLRRPRRHLHGQGGADLPRASQRQS